MANAKPAEKDPAIVAYAQAKVDEAWALREEYETFVARRKANREQLRNMAVAGDLSDEQRAEVEELYPKRQSGEGEPVDEAADAA